MMREVQRGSNVHPRITIPRDTWNENAVQKEDGTVGCGSQHRTFRNRYNRVIESTLGRDSINSLLEEGHRLGGETMVQL